MHRPASDPSFIDILITDHAGRNDQAVFRVFWRATV